MDERKEQLEYLYYDCKMSISQMARHLHMKPPTLYRELRQLGIKMRPRGGPNKPRILENLERDGLDVMQIIKEAGNLDKAAVRLGVSRGTLYKWLKRRTR